MRIQELSEQTVPVQDPQLTGNVAALNDPAMQAAQLAQRQKEKLATRRAIQDQIAALNKQLADLNRS